MNATEFELYEDHDGLYRMRSRVDGHLVAKDVTAEDALALFVLGKERAELLEALIWMVDEFEQEDHNLAYPRCNYESHRRYNHARNLITHLSQ